MGKVSVQIAAVSGGILTVGGYAAYSGTITASGVTSKLQPKGKREYSGLGASGKVIRASIDVECKNPNDIEYSTGDTIKLGGGTALIVSIVKVKFNLHCSISNMANDGSDTAVDPGLGLELFADEWEVV